MSQILQVKCWKAHDQYTSVWGDVGNQWLFMEHPSSRPKRLPTRLLWQWLWHVQMTNPYNEEPNPLRLLKVSVQHIRDDRSPWTHPYCTICFHSLLFRNRPVHAPFIVPTATCHRHDEGRKKSSDNLRLELCGTVNQEVEEAASFDKVAAKYDLQNRSDYTGNPF